MLARRRHASIFFAMKARRSKPDGFTEDGVVGKVLSGMDGLRREKKEAAHACAPHRSKENNEALLLFLYNARACSEARALLQN
jgi:hypothetical protein